MNMLALQVIIGTLPVTLTNGTVADATQVMSDLNYIVSQVNANAAPLSNTALLNANNNFTVHQSGVAGTGVADFPIISQVQNQAFNTLSSVTGSNTITGTAAITPAAYQVGQIWRFTPAAANTGAATLNVSGLGAAALKWHGQALVGSEMNTAAPYMAFVSDSTAPTMDLLGGGIPLPFFDSDIFVENASDRTKRLKWDLSSLSSSTTHTLAVPNQDMTLVGTTTPQTLTGKTIAANANTFNMTPLSNSIPTNIALNNTGAFFDGPAVAQGTAGTWYASGTVTVKDTSASASFYCKLHDGTNIVASGVTLTPAVNNQQTVSLSGVFVSPTGNIRISVKDISTTSGLIVASDSGITHDSSIVAFRIG